jgi:hypothetical protein
VKAIAVIASVLLVSTAVATDPRDAGGKLDLRSVKAVRDGKLLRLTISTYGPWDSKLLRSEGMGTSRPPLGRNRLTVLYDVNRDGKADFTGRIVYRGKLSMWIGGKGSAFEPVPVSRPNPSSVRLVHPVDVLFSGGGTKTLRLAITSMNGTHRDRLPDHGWITLVYHL